MNDAANEILKISSLEAEQSAIGSSMLNTAGFMLAVNEFSLKTEDFAIPKHQLIFRAILSLIEQNHPVDPITLSEHLNSQGLLKAAGEGTYIGFLARNTPSVANLRAYIRIVKEKAALRAIANVAQSLLQAILQPIDVKDGVNSQTLITSAEQQFLEIMKGEHRRLGFQRIEDILAKTILGIEARANSGTAISGVPTHFHELDQTLCGLQPGDLIILAARPSMGKTAFAMNIARQVAISRQLIAIFSLEMSAEQLLLRVLSTTAEISLQHLRSGQLQDQEWQAFGQAADLVASIGEFILVDETPSIGLDDMRSKLQLLQSKHGQLGLIVVDYLQLVKVAGYQSDNRVNEVSEISRTLKAFAREFNVPVLALSQLNRSLENRQEKRPQMSDLRDSGSIEQDADVILFIYRDEVYNPNTPEPGIAEIIIAKQRNGPTGTIRLKFNPTCVKFSNF